MKKYRLINTAALIGIVSANLVMQPVCAGATEYQNADTDMEISSADCEVIYKTTYDFSQTIPKYPNDLKVSASGYDGIYDGASHGITVGCQTSGAVITYSTDGKNYTTRKPVYTDVGTYVTYYKVEKDGSATVIGSETVTIRKAFIDYSSKDYDGTYDGKAHGISVSVSTKGCKILYSEDGVNYSPTKPEYKEAGTYVTYYQITKDNYETVTGRNEVIIRPKAVFNTNVQTGDDSNIPLLAAMLGTSGLALAGLHKKREEEAEK